MPSVLSILSRLHPVSLIAGWLALLLAAANVERFWAVSGALALSLVALAVARSRFSLLLRRSRWLLLTLVLTFGLLTPGTRLFAGMSVEGLWLAVEAVGRLLTALASLSLLLECQTPLRLIVGLRAFLAPLELWTTTKELRDRLAVRLVLTLEAIEAVRADTQRQGSEQRETATTLTLPHIRFQPADGLICSAAIGLTLILALGGAA